MRFILLGLNVIVLVLLGAYLLDVMGMKSFGINGTALLLVSSVAVLLVVDHLVDKLQMKNPLMYLVPGLIAVVAPVVMIRQVTIASVLGVLLMVPGLVLIIRQSVK